MSLNAENLTLNLQFLQAYAKQGKTEEGPEDSPVVLLQRMMRLDCCNEGEMEKNSTDLPNYRCLEKPGGIDLKKVGEKQS